MLSYPFAEIRRSIQMMPEPSNSCSVIRHAFGPSLRSTPRLVIGAFGPASTVENTRGGRECGCFRYVRAIVQIETWDKEVIPTTRLGQS